ncbi:hypothetical protein [Nostoc sp.]|uniref:hypothetical protein n=1 Tax=Nostoc sp. TaxID=1180 RepID=UPI002FFA7A0D
MLLIVAKNSGILITDHHPHLSAWNFQGLGLWLWNLRLWLYRLIKPGGHTTAAEQTWGLATEVHHRLAMDCLNNTRINLTL